jgi:methyl-galactoside transport system substrate-binding protein
MERAMYTKSIAYKHYGANGDQATQTQQAQQVLNAGCAALVVELVDQAAAAEIVSLASAKNVPVVFINTEVVSTYDKCVSVVTAENSLAGVLGEMIAADLVKNGKKYDRNGDGKISGTLFGQLDTAEIVSAVNTALADKELTLEIAAGEMDAVVGAFTEEAPATELILTDSDETALEVLQLLQEKGYNSTRLVTHFVPLYTVGADADARAFTDTSTMKEEEKAALIFTAENLVGKGRISGTALDAYDNIAAQVAKVVAGFIKGNAAEASVLPVPYTTVTG